MKTETPKFFECDFDQKQPLFQAYMPFIKEGGLYIQSNVSCDLGETVEVKVSLSLDSEKIESFQFQANVIWVTPESVSGYYDQAGIGVQLKDPNAKALRAAIENHLADKLNTDKAVTEHV